MKRPEEVSAAFEAILRKISVPAEEQEKSVHFWATGECTTLQSVEEAHGPMMKIPLHKFLAALCQEFSRLEDDMETMLPDLYKMLDETADGFMSRYYLYSLISCLAPSLLYGLGCPPCVLPRTMPLDVLLRFSSSQMVMLMMATTVIIRTEFDQIESITGGTEKEMDQLWEACLAAKGPEVDSSPDCSMASC